MTADERDNLIDDIPAALVRWGCSAVAYLAFKGGLNRYGSDTHGYINFCEFAGAAFALGDPVAPREKWNELMAGYCHRFRRPVFVQTGRESATILSTMGLNTSRFGVETEVETNLDLIGRPRREIRNLYNRGAANEVCVTELSRGDLLRIRQLEQELKTNGHRSRFKYGLSFLAQSRYDLGDKNIRWFVGLVDWAIVGFSVFYPIYQYGTVVAYAEILPYQSRTAPKGTRVKILIDALAQFASEEIGYVNIGLSPFRSSDESDTPKNAAEYLFGLTYRFGNSFFNFQGLAFHKSRYDGREKEVYFASRESIPLLSLLKLYRLSTGSWLPPIF